MRKIGDRKETAHRKRKILQNSQVGGGLLTFMEKQYLKAFFNVSTSDVVPDTGLSTPTSL